MDDADFARRVLPIEIAAGREDFFGAHCPSTFRCLAIAPPRQDWRQLSKLEWLRLGVSLAPKGKRMLVEPHFLRRPGTIEEQHIRRNRRIRGEDAVREPNDSVKIELP